MRHLGTHKTHSHVAGHQHCAVCHPKQKGGRAAEKRRYAMRRYLDADLVPGGYWDSLLSAIRDLPTARDAHGEGPPPFV